jgi:hypothetical protein
MEAAVGAVMVTGTTIPFVRMHCHELKGMVGPSSTTTLAASSEYVPTGTVPSAPHVLAVPGFATDVPPLPRTPDGFFVQVAATDVAERAGPVVAGVPLV